MFFLLAFPSPLPSQLHHTVVCGNLGRHSVPILSYLRESCKRIGNIHSRYAHTVIPRFAVEKRLLGLAQELLIPLTTFDHKFLSYFRFSLLTSPRIRCFFSFLLLMAIQTNSSSFGGQPAIVPHQAELLAELVASVDLEELCDAFHSKQPWTSTTMQAPRE